MNVMIRLQLVLLWLLGLSPLITVAQDDYYPPKNAPARARYVIVLRDGTELRGELLRQDSAEAVVRTRDLGEVRLRSEQILRIEREGARGEGVTYPNSFPQLMRIAPTAFTVEKGRARFGQYYLYISQIEYGINDNWSVSVGVYPFLPTNFFTVSTKVSLPLSNRVRIGATAQYLTTRFGNDFNGLGYVQGIVTTGDRQNNTTYGLGWSLTNRGLSTNTVATFGLVRKVGPRLSFISENFALFGSGINRSVDFAGLLSGGVRFNRQRHAFDLAGYIPLIINRRNTIPFLFLPYGSYHLRIGK